MSAIEVIEARRAYPGKVAVDGASLRLEKGRITALLGPSGCGKSTLLRLIAGLEPLDAGEVRAGDRVLSGRSVHIPPEERDVGFLFQDYALFPHLTVEDNVGFGLRRIGAAERAARIAAELEEVRLAHRAKAYPQALSGGEQQRVALARALARRPSAMLLDEPFSGLDGRLKAEVRETTLRALRDAGAAALVVTHDAEEAMMMADELVLMDEGRILQSGAPRDCYLNPASAAAARLLGEAALIPAVLEGGKARSAFGAIDHDGEGQAQVMIRPEGLQRSAGGVEAVVAEVSFAGGFVLARLKAGGASAYCRLALADAPAPGETIRVDLDPAFCAIFPGG